MAIRAVFLIICLSMSCELPLVLSTFLSVGAKSLSVSLSDWQFHCRRSLWRRCRKCGRVACRHRRRYATLVSSIALFLYRSRSSRSDSAPWLMYDPLQQRMEETQHSRGSSFGTVTRSQFYQRVNKGKLDSRSLPRLHGDHLYWVENQAPTWPEPGDKENGKTQPWVRNVLGKLCSIERPFGGKDTYEVRLHRLKVDKTTLEEECEIFRFHVRLQTAPSGSPIYSSRKPDHPGFCSDSTDPLSIGLVGDCKGYSGTEFSDDEKGHALDFGQSLLIYADTVRPFVFVFLTNGTQFQFFRITRVRRSVFQYEESAVYLEYDGWNRLFGLLAMDSGTLGYKTPDSHFYNFRTILGTGAFSVVYEAIPRNGNGLNTVVAKVYLEKARRDHELWVLTDLHRKNVRHIPTPVNSENVSGPQFLLISSPAGARLAVDRRQNSLLPTFRELVWTLEAAHQAEWFHCDIKPSNTFFAAGEVFLNDWGSARRCEERIDEFTDAFSATHKGIAGDHPTPASDLTSLAMTFYSLVTGLHPTLPYGGFWDAVPEVWSPLFSAAAQGDYHTVYEEMSKHVVA